MELNIAAWPTKLRDLRQAEDIQQLVGFLVEEPAKMEDWASVEGKLKIADRSPQSSPINTVDGPDISTTDS